MKKYLFLLLILIGNNSFSQELDSIKQSEIIDKIEDLNPDKDYLKIIDSCDKYIPYKFSVCIFEAKLYACKAYAFGKVIDSLEDMLKYDDNADYYDSIENDLIIQVINLYKKASVVCDLGKLTYLNKKYFYEIKYKTVDEEDLLVLKNNGFKESKEFWALSPQYFYGNNQWIGIELSAEIFNKKYIIKNVDSAKMFVWSTTNIGYRKNISTTNGWGLNLSLISFSYNYINVRPINFTYLNDGTNSSFGYSPELGFQFWYFRMNVGYNFAFKKKLRNYEKLYFTAKVNIPFYYTEF